MGRWLQAQARLEQCGGHPKPAAQRLQAGVGSAQLERWLSQAKG